MSTPGWTRVGIRCCRWRRTAAARHPERPAWHDRSLPRIGHLPVGRAEMAHIERRATTTRDGKQKVSWRARYRDPQGRERVRVFPRRVDAERFLVSMEHAKLRGEWT